MKLFFSLFLLCIGTPVADAQCSQLPGKLKQLDTGNGKAYGVTKENKVVRWDGCSWVPLPGKMKYVTVGKGGVLGIDMDYKLCKFDDKKWKRIKALKDKIRQVDAGGTGIVVVVTIKGSVYCANIRDKTFLASSSVFHKIPGNLVHYSCGKTCWGVNSNDEVFFRHNVTLKNCAGSRWEKVKGLMVSVEVAADGSVYAIGRWGKIYKRMGITPTNHVGTSWRVISTRTEIRWTRANYDSDSNSLWLLNKDGNIVRCEFPKC